MNSQEKAQDLVSKFGKEIALKVAEELLNRDKQWIEKLSKEEPDRWQLSDIKKSEKMFEELKEQIQ